jgi:hypothetical protein
VPLCERLVQDEGLFTQLRDHVELAGFVKARYADCASAGATSMTLSKTLVAAAALTFLIGTPQAHAQHRGGGARSRGGNGGGHSAATPRVSVPRSVGAPHARAPVYGTPRVVPAAPRSYSYGAVRGYSAAPRGGVVAGRAVPRVIVPRGIGPRIGGVAPVRFYRPYYVFHPRFSVGLGLWVGFPIAFPYYGYYDPYYYPYAYSYPYPNPAYGYPYSTTSYPAYPPSNYPQSTYPPPLGSVGVQPGQSQQSTGGVSFEITPSAAEVFVDGIYVGTAGQFMPTTQPLGLTPGRHQIEIRAPGYQTIDVDADIVAGQVIPYQGTMQR